MIKKRVFSILLSIVLLFSFSAVTFAKKAAEIKNDKKNISLVSKKVDSPVRSMDDRIAAKKAFSKVRGFTKSQVEQLAVKRNVQSSKGEMVPFETAVVPGAGDIYPYFNASFDQESDFLMFDLIDLSENAAGNDWMWFDYTQFYGEAYRYLNSAFAPEPGGDFGVPDVVAKDEVMQIKVGVPKESDMAVPYRVADLYLNMYVGEPDPDDYLNIDLLEAPKWNVVDDMWAMTSHQFGGMTYGTDWIEDLVTAPITLPADPATLSFNHLITTELDWDGGNLKISADGGATWELLVPNEGYDIEDLWSFKHHAAIANGGSDADIEFGVPTIWDEPGFTNDHMSAFAPITVDLSAYAGMTVQIKWQFTADGGYEEPDGGWWVDDIMITAGGATVFENAGVDDGTLVAERQAPGYMGEPWITLVTVSGLGGESIDGTIDLTTNLIGAPGDSIDLRFRAVYDDNDEGTGSDPNWGFEVTDAILSVYTRYANDLGVSFVDLDSTFTNGGAIAVGETYDPQVVVSNFGLSNFTIFNTFVKITNQFGTEVYNRFLYTYAPAQGDTLFMYPGMAEFNDEQEFYNFPDWTPEFEGDYTLTVYTEVFGGDDEPLNDEMVVHFHVYSTPPAFYENFNDMTDDGLNAEWTKTGDDVFALGDIFGGGDLELTVFDYPAAADADAMIMTPSFDCSEMENVYINMEHWYRARGDQPNSFAHILISGDGGVTFDTLKTLLSDAYMTSAERYGYFMYNATATAAGKSDVVLAFHDVYQAGVQHFFTIDDIAVYSSPDMIAPDTTSSFAGVSGDMSAVINWAAVTGASYYTLYVAESDTLDNAEVAVETSKLTVTLEELVNDVPLYFWLTVTDFNNNTNDPVGPIMVTPHDATAPAKITTLTASSIDDTTKIITWLSPAESLPEEGSVYSIRYSYAPITADNFAAATEIVADKPVLAAGTPDTLVVVVETPNVDVFFAIVATDEAGNASALSNVAIADDIAPAAVTDLAVLAATQTTVTLQWTAVGDDDLAGGAATSYDVRVVYEPYPDGIPEWDKAAKLTNIPVPSAPGTVETFVVTELVYPEFSKMTFALTVTDNNGNVSALSNVAISELWFPVGIEEATKLPETFAIAQNYPNPFNPTTMISYQLPKSANVKLQVFSATGQLIRTLVDGTVSAGYHNMNWDARDNAGHQVASGVYFYRIQAEDFTSIKKMTLMK